MPDESPDLFEIIRTTRSMRRLKPNPVPNQLIRKILEAGVCAPSGGNMQRWRFLVVRDPKVKETVGAFTSAPGTNRWPYGTGRVNRLLAPAESGLSECWLRRNIWPLHPRGPVWIVPCLEGANPDPKLWLLDLPAVQNMLLAARALARL